MAFDFKKEYKEFYMPKAKPEIVTVLPANYIAVRGKGDPNEEGGAYKKAVGILYAVAYTLKMSYKGTYKIDGYFDYVVPPLEGFWRQNSTDGIDYSNKSGFEWISVIRLPDFIKKEDFDWAVAEASKKEKTRLFVRRVFVDRRGNLRSDDACRQLRQRTRYGQSYGRIRGGERLCKRFVRYAVAP